MDRVKRVQNRLAVRLARAWRIMHHLPNDAATIKPESPFPFSRQEGSSPGVTGIETPVGPMLRARHRQGSDATSRHSEVMPRRYCVTEHLGRRFRVVSAPSRDPGV